MCPCQSHPVNIVYKGMMFQVVCNMLHYDDSSLTKICFKIIEHIIQALEFWLYAESMRHGGRERVSAGGPSSN